MALAPAGIDVRSSLGGRLVFEVFRTDADDALIVDGTAVYSLQELQNDGTLKSYDFNDNTFKTTALTTPTASLNHRTSNNSTTNTGLWTAALTTISGFTVGGVYYETFTLTPATGPSTGGITLVRKWQFGGSVGDDVAQTGDSFARIGANGASLTSLATASSITTLQSDTDDIQTRLPSALTANGNMKSSLVEILTTALTETAGLLAGGFKKFFNIATPTGTVNSLPGAVPGASGGLLIDDVWTDARAGYLDNLNVGGLVASSAEATSIQNNTRTVRVVPDVFERPDSGSTVFRIELLLYDEVGNMEAPDAAPTISVVNQGGSSRDANLDSTTMTLVSTGRYRSTYTVDTAHALEELIFAFSVVEGGATRIYGNGSQVVDTTAVDFTASDRTVLQGLATSITTLQSDTDDMQTRLPAALVAGKMDSHMADIAADAITASAIAADAVAEIQSGLAGSTALATLQTEITEMHGLLGLYSGVRDSVYSGANLTSYNVFIYDSSAHASTNDGSTGVLHEYSVVNTYSGANLATSIMTKVS